MKNIPWDVFFLIFVFFGFPFCWDGLDVVGIWDDVVGVGNSVLPFDTLLSMEELEMCAWHLPRLLEPGLEWGTHTASELMVHQSLLMLLMVAMVTQMMISKQVQEAQEPFLGHWQIQWTSYEMGVQGWQCCLYWDYCWGMDWASCRWQHFKFNLKIIISVNIINFNCLNNLLIKRHSI